MDIGEASVKYVEKCLTEHFSHIFGDPSIKTEKQEITHILADVEWHESHTDRTEVYPLLLIEPIYKKDPNNFVCLCPPFNKRIFED